MSDNDDGSTVYSKPHLDPQAVIALAESIPNCSRVAPPRIDRRADASSSAGANAEDATGGGSASQKSPYGRSKSDSAPAPPSSYSYFSTFSRRLQHTFSNEERQRLEEEEEKRRNDKRRREDEILSFLVSDAHSIERLAAEADGTGKHASTSELEGAGIARIDVYCQTGTVCTCRVIHAAAADPVDEGKADADANDASERGGSSTFVHMLSTPRKGNMSQVGKDGDCITQERTQVRRIIRRKCTIEALRRILEEPPRLPEINESIIAYSPDDDDTDGSDSKEGDEDSSNASTVSKLLRKRQQKRRNKKNVKFSKLSKEQRTFLKAQQKKYEKRVRRDEKVRMHVGNAILAAGMGGPGSEMGADLTAMRSLSLDDTTVTSGGQAASSRDGKNADDDEASAPPSDAYLAQKAIQERIEIADFGLAILMGEAQRLERIMAAMREKRDKELAVDTETDPGSKGGDDGDDTDADLTIHSGVSKRSSGSTTARDDDSRSFSTMQSTDRDFGDDDDDSTVVSQTSRSTLGTLGDSSEEERKVARRMQGCECEYSFPHDYHDELEGALMNEDIVYDSQSSWEDDDEDDDSEEISRASSRAPRRRRGRSPPKDGKASPTNASPHASKKNRKAIQIVSPIVAIPTNGEGCVVLRENGAFDVIGNIPNVLRKKLFRSNGPMPDQIALGTLGRYYVHFMDGSFFFYGPPSLSKILIRGNNQMQRRVKNRNKGKKSEVSVVSVAFGKHLDDFFVVRSDGSWETSGSLPPGLEGLMKDRKGRADLLWVALGADDEWCVRSRNGRVWWEGVSDEADEALADILAEDGENELKFIDFGRDDTYFLLHK